MGACTAASPACRHEQLIAFDSEEQRKNSGTDDGKGLEVGNPTVSKGR